MPCLAACCAKLVCMYASSELLDKITVQVALTVVFQNFEFLVFHSGAVEVSFCVGCGAASLCD